MKRLARRISDIVFVMIKTQSPYSKEKILENMRRRKSPYLPKENEGEMAISTDEISFESLLEIDEPCLTLADYFNLSEEKREEKITHVLKNRTPAEAPSIQKRASKSLREPPYWARHRYYQSDFDVLSKGKSRFTGRFWPFQGAGKLACGS